MKTTMKTQQKLENLREIIHSMESVLVCFSGGVDSTFLLKIAVDKLGPNQAVGLLEHGPLYPENTTAEARRLAGIIGARLDEVEMEPLEGSEVESNPSDRCYHCKSGLLAHAREVADRLGIRHVAEGTNADDVEDYRPGLRAVKQLDARSPLLEAGLTKDEIRASSRELGLPTWDRPASPCLASRFPFGTRIDRKAVDMVNRSEEALSREGFREFRVRYHDEVARIELAAGEIARMFEGERYVRIARACREAGFRYVALDLDGYRTGSLNPVSHSKEKISI